MATSILHIALVGDFDPGVTTHQAIPRALALAAEARGGSVAPVWLPTEQIAGDADLAPFDAIWCVPASSYRSTDGALRAIRFARERGHALPAGARGPPRRAAAGRRRLSRGGGRVPRQRPRGRGLNRARSAS